MKISITQNALILGALCALSAASQVARAQEAPTPDEVKKALKAEEKQRSDAIQADNRVRVNQARGQNPFITSLYTADPTARVWKDGRLYVYPSHDLYPSRGSDLMDQYHVYSTDDLVNWKDHGEILRSSDIAWGRPKGGFMWAPDCVYRDGKYYFYYPHPSTDKWNETWKIGVAVSDRPDRDFVQKGYIAGVGGKDRFDPSVFIDDDGEVYFFVGGGGKPEGTKLKKDMVTLDGPMKPIAGLERFHEGMWIFKRQGIYYKRQGIYYMMHSDGESPDNSMRYSTSKSPLGPWQPRGAFLGATQSNTSHGAVVEFRGDWYIFYHNQAISNADAERSIAVDRLNFNADGTLQMVVQTKNGPPAVGPISAKKYQAETAKLSGNPAVKSSAAASGAGYVGNMQEKGNAVEFAGVDGGKGGMASLRLVYGSQSRAHFLLTVNGVDYNYLNTFPTENWEVFNGIASITVKLKPGATNTVRFEGGKEGANFDYLEVVPNYND